MLTRHSFYPNNPSPAEELSLQERQKSDNLTASPFNIETTTTFSNNDEKGSFPLHDLKTMQ